MILRVVIERPFLRRPSYYRNDDGPVVRRVAWAWVALAVTSGVSEHEFVTTAWDWRDR